jgi:ABC-type proline/glycine betaine transport system permease subunit
VTSLALAAVSYNMAGAIAATGIGETTIAAAIKNSDLIAHYVGVKVVIRAVDLDEWVQSLPTERRSA